MNNIVFKLDSNLNIKKINNAIALANEIINNEVFYERIKQHPSFDMSTTTPTEIAEKIKYSTNFIQCNVKLYRKRWSRANAYFIASRPNDININTAKLNRSLGSIVATMVHEYVHMVDNFDKEESYGHGDNSARGKQNTAPYWIDNLAQHLAGDKVDFNNTESSKIVYRRSLWSKIKNLFKRVF